MKRSSAILLAAVVCSFASFQVQADAVTTLQDEYKAAGAGPFSAAKGEAMWTQKRLDKKSGKERSCSTCHTEDLKAASKHVKTGKPIDPLAPSVNSERLTDIKFINKWFKRNCKWTFGRECTPQEKGDFLEFIRAQ